MQRFLLWCGYGFACQKLVETGGNGMIYVKRQAPSPRRHGEVEPKSQAREERGVEETDDGHAVD